MRVHIKIKRFDQEKNCQTWWSEYDLEAEPLDRVLDLLNVIKEHHDDTLAFRHSCGHGICGSDAVCINGRNVLACKVLVKDIGPKMVIQPLPGLPVLRDLIVDMDAFFAKYRVVQPYLLDDGQPPERERLQSPAEQQRFEEATRCILCAACTSSCPSFWANGDYIGPAAVIQAYRFIFDSRDQGLDQRLSILNEKMGVWRCRLALNCFNCCPRHIDLPRHISELKMALLSGEV